MKRSNDNKRPWIPALTSVSQMLTRFELVTACPGLDPGAGTALSRAPPSSWWY